MDTQVLSTYIAVALLSVVSPGPAVMLAIRNSLSRGLGAVIWSSLGNVSGLFVLSAASMAGLGALLKTSSTLFTVVKVIGAAYLIYLGIRQLMALNRPLNLVAQQALGEARATGLGLLREAFFVAATNPKPVLFFSALFPQFIDTGAPILPQFFILTGIFMALSFCTLMSYAAVAGRARHWLANEGAMRWLNRSFGSIFILMGGLLLFLKRPAEH